MKQNNHKNKNELSELSLLQEKSGEELIRMKKTLDTQLADLRMAGLVLPSELARTFELVQEELANRGRRE